MTHLSYWNTQLILTSENLFALFVSVPYALSLNNEHVKVSPIIQSKS